MASYWPSQIADAMDRLEETKRRWQRLENTDDYKRFEAQEEFLAAFKAFSEMVRSVT